MFKQLRRGPRPGRDLLRSAILFVGVVLTAPLLAPMLAAQGAAALAAELKAKADDADPAIVAKLVAEGSRDAAAGLIAAYPAMRTVHMQREIARALAALGRADAARQPALQRLTELAGSSATAAEVRAAAIAGLSGGGDVGRQFLRQLVDSDVGDPVREEALRAHVEGAAAGADDAWYRQLWNLSQERRKRADGTVLPDEWPAVRELAFQALAPRLAEPELVAALRQEVDPKIRRAALATMAEREMPKTGEMARWLLERVDLPGADRAHAAALLAEREGAGAVPTFLGLARKRDVTPDDLREEMARRIAAMDDPAVEKAVAKLVGKGKPHDKVFALQAIIGTDDPKVLKVIRKGLGDREFAVRRQAARTLAASGDKGALAPLHKTLAKAADPADRRVAIEAIGVLDTSLEWLDQLASLARDDAREVRNAALQQLAAARDDKHEAVLLEALAHTDPATRLVVAKAVAASRRAAAVPVLIARLEAESGRVRRVVADALWQLTGEPFDDDPVRWKQWWAEHGADFRVIEVGDLAVAEAAREARRLRQRTVAGSTFFGISVESERVIFIIDVSGSMLEPMQGREVDGRLAARIDVAKEELTRSIEGLAPTALFNIYAFSNGVAKWQKDGIGTNTAQKREDALAWVDRLGATGGTNLFDSMEQAFADRDVDSIFVLSDGEPTVGKVIDYHGIREEVKFWNEHRGVVIHTVAIGDRNVEVLEWLAADSGGRHVRMR